MRSAIGAKDHRARKEEEWSEGKDFSRIKKKANEEDEEKLADGKRISMMFPSFVSPRFP